MFVTFHLIKIDLKYNEEYKKISGIRVVIISLNLIHLDDGILCT